MQLNCQQEPNARVPVLRHEAGGLVGKKMMRSIYCVMLAIAAVMTLQAESPSMDLRLRVPSIVETVPDAQPVFLSTTVSQPGQPPSVHAGSLTKLSDGRLMAAWFAGSREGAKDVCIYSSIYSPKGGWSEQKVIASREQTATDLHRYIRKLGNPVLTTAPDGRVWMFYVTVSMGGWSGSSVTTRFSDDEGATWSPAERLNCAPFLNVSTLVKGRPLLTESGHFLLPVYHEFVRKFGELLVIDSEGKFVNKFRLNADGGAIQPWGLVRDEKRMSFFYRQWGHEEELTLNNEFDLATEQWTDVTTLDVRNPNSALAIVRRWNGQMLMIGNCGVGRERLTVLASDDGQEWEELRDFEASEIGAEYSYPYIIRGHQSGTYHLIYTWQRSQMKVLTFNDAWLNDADAMNSESTFDQEIVR